MNRHTAGPWEATRGQDGHWRIWSRAFAEADLLLVSWDTNAEQNARLIAEAPALLECCQAMLELYDAGSWGAPPSEYLPVMRATIARATGEASS